MNIQSGNKSLETLACLIIDDPLLKPQYGCLDYKNLLAKMKAHNFFTELAFIPWNYKRSDAKTVRLFADNPEYYAICVHGCNHMGNEFGRGSYDELKDLSSTALWRMEQHKKLTGLPYNPVIVFPQGRFSSVAMKALKDVGYVAAFNSTNQATDVIDLPAIEDHHPATMIYHDFPLFLRRYPEEKTHFIKDIAAGRPIVLVQHHGDFKNGYNKITDTVDWINGLGNIRWTSLLKIAEHYLEIKATNVGKSAKHVPLQPHLRAKVAMRRFLCEARDNYVETSDLLTNIYKMVRG